MRDQKVKYILNNFNAYRAKMIEYLCDNGYDIAKDILDGGESGKFDEMQGWYDHALDTAIESVDWSAISQCEQCKDYFDDQEYPAFEYPDDRRFCSQSCDDCHNDTKQEINALNGLIDKYL